MRTFARPQVTIEEIKAYTVELGQVLRTRDAKQLQAFVRKHNAWLDPELVDKVPRDVQLAELMLHKMTCARSDLFDLHEESQRWLRQHGYSVEIK